MQQHQLSIVRAFTDVAKDRNTDLFSAVDLMQHQPGLMDSDVAINWENRCVDVRGQVAFKQPKSQGLGGVRCAIRTFGTSLGCM